MSVTDSVLKDIRSIVESVLPPLQVESDTEVLILPTDVPEGAEIELLPESSGPSHTSLNKIPSEDGQYVKKHLGIPLCLALAEIVRIRPSDPIHFLGHWLMKWHWNTDEKQRDIDRVNALTAEQKRIEEEIEEKKQRAEMRLQKENDEKRQEAEEVITLELDRLFEGLELPDLPEPVKPESEPELQQEVIAQETDDDDYHDKDSVHSYEHASETQDDSYDSPRSPKRYESDEQYEDDNYDDDYN